MSKRGANQIGSYPRHFLSNPVTDEVTDVVVWTDTCGRQNRNRFIVAMCLDVIEGDTNKIQRITSKYFEPSHSQSEVDSIHTTHETALEKYGIIFLPSEYFTISKHAKKFANVKGNEYTASMLGTDHCPVFNIMPFDKMRVKKTNKYLDEQGKEIKVSWMSAKNIYMGGTSDNKPLPQSTIWITYNCHYYEDALHDGENEPKPLNNKKLKGLMDMVKKRLILVGFHYFYNGLSGDISAMEEEEFDSEL